MGWGRFREFAEEIFGVVGGSESLLKRFLVLSEVPKVCRRDFWRRRRFRKYAEEIFCCVGGSDGMSWEVKGIFGGSDGVIGKLRGFSEAPMGCLGS